MIAVHLDLKGVMFRPSYIPELLADLAGQGINTVLVEYEDIFPFKGIDIALDKRVVWSRATLLTFLDEARRNKIEVIPLQQCLGHLEYVYRWDKYRRHALDRKYPSTLNIDDTAACALIHEMLGQKIAAHPNSRYVHLGMDEAHALVVHAKETKQDVLEIFLRHLERLCDICDAHGKIPLMWSDMFEDHINPGSLKLFEKFKDRVVLCTWDYGSRTERIATGRIAGNRVSRAWLDEPENPQAPVVSGGSTFIEDMPAPLKKLVAPYLAGREFQSMFQVDMWTSLGFKVIGSSAARASADGAVLGFINNRIANIQMMSLAVQRTNQLGHMATSWARGTTFCPPNCSIDTTWPQIAELSRSMGAKPRPFFAGIPPRTVERLMKTLGRSRQDWRLEERVADEMEELAPKLKSHRYEWDGMIIMARLLALHRQAEFAVMEVDYFHANNHPVVSEWQRRIDDQSRALKELTAMKRQVRAHFAQRYHGAAFEEWLRDLFDLHISNLQEAKRVSREKLKVARKLYASL